MNSRGIHKKYGQILVPGMANESKKENVDDVDRMIIIIIMYLKNAFFSVDITKFEPDLVQKGDRGKIF